MTSTRKWNLERYEKKRHAAECCLENAQLCEQIAAEEIISDPAEAIFWQKKAIGIRETLYGKNSMENIIQYEKLVEYYLENGTPKSALPFGKRILKIRKKALGDCHIDIAESNRILSEIYSNFYLADYENALLCAETAAEIERINRPAENPVSYRTHLQLAGIYGFRYVHSSQSAGYESKKPEEDAEREREHYRCAMESAGQEYGEDSVEAAKCYRLYAHIIESRPDVRLALCAKALKIFYEAEGAKGSNTRWAAADIWYSWLEGHWFPWEKNKYEKTGIQDRTGIGYGIKWIAQNVSKEIGEALVQTFDARDQDMITAVLNTPGPVPPVIK